MTRHRCPLRRSKGKLTVPFSWFCFVTFLVLTWVVLSQARGNGTSEADEPSGERRREGEREVVVVGRVNQSRKQLHRRSPQPDWIFISAALLICVPWQCDAPQQLTIGWGSSSATPPVTIHNTPPPTNLLDLFGVSRGGEWSNRKQ